MPAAEELEEATPEWSFADDSPGVSVVIPREAPGHPGKVQYAAQNTNPGNLTKVGGSFKKYDTPEEGYQDLLGYIDTHAKKGLTLEQYVTKYAPPNENDTETYIKNAEKAVGVGRTTPLSQIDRDKLAQFQAHQESGAKIQTGADAKGWSFADEPAKEGSASGWSFADEPAATAQPSATPAIQPPSGLPGIAKPPLPDALRTTQPQQPAPIAPAAQPGAVQPTRVPGVQILADEPQKPQGPQIPGYNVMMARPVSGPGDELHCERTSGTCGSHETERAPAARWSVS